MRSQRGREDVIGGRQGQGGVRCAGVCRHYQCSWNAALQELQIWASKSHPKEASPGLVLVRWTRLFLFLLTGGLESVGNDQ